MIIRKATTEDLSDINDIYNQAVAARQTGDTSPVSMSSRREWFKSHHQHNYPVFVVEKSGNVIGWLSFRSYRIGREAFRHTAEISYYIHKDYHKQGIGSELIRFALKTAPGYGFKNLFAVILDTNVASKKLMEKFNFTQWAYMPQVADFGGFICGHVYYGVNL